MSIEEYENHLKAERSNRQDRLKTEFSKIAYRAKKENNYLPPFKPSINPDQEWNEHEEFYMEEEVSHCSGGDRHNPETTLRKNAESVLKSSSKDPTYNNAIREAMIGAFRNKEYDTVLEIALSVDADRREIKRSTPERLTRDEQLNLKREIQQKDSFMAYLFDEVLGNVNLEDTEELERECYPILAGLSDIEVLCNDAIRFLKKDLTYDNRAEASTCLQDIIDQVEKLKAIRVGS